MRSCVSGLFSHCPQRDQFEYVLERLGGHQNASSLPNWCENLIHVPLCAPEMRELRTNQKQRNQPQLLPPAHTRNGSNNNNNGSNAADNDVVRLYASHACEMGTTKLNNKNKNTKNGINKSKNQTEQQRQHETRMRIMLAQCRKKATKAATQHRNCALLAARRDAAEYESCACADDAADADVDIDVKSRDVDFESVAKQKR